MRSRSTSASTAMLQIRILPAHHETAVRLPSPASAIHDPSQRTPPRIVRIACERHSARATKAPTLPSTCVRPTSTDPARIVCYGIQPPCADTTATPIRSTSGFSRFRSCPVDSIHAS